MPRRDLLAASPSRRRLARPTSRYVSAHGEGNRRRTCRPCSCWGAPETHARAAPALRRTHPGRRDRGRGLHRARPRRRRRRPTPSPSRSTPPGSSTPGTDDPSPARDNPAWRSWARPDAIVTRLAAPARAIDVRGLVRAGGARPRDQGSPSSPTRHAHGNGVCAASSSVADQRPHVDARFHAAKTNRRMLGRPSAAQARAVLALGPPRRTLESTGDVVVQPCDGRRHAACLLPSASARPHDECLANERTNPHPLESRFAGHGAVSGASQRRSQRRLRNNFVVNAKVAGDVLRTPSARSSLRLEARAEFHVNEELPVQVQGRRSRRASRSSARTRRPRRRSRRRPATSSSTRATRRSAR